MAGFSNIYKPYMLGNTGVCFVIHILPRYESRLMKLNEYSQNMRCIAPQTSSIIGGSEFDQNNEMEWPKAFLVLTLKTL